jgi:hypothetical protein
LDSLLPFESLNVNPTRFIPAFIRPRSDSRILRYAVVNTCKRTFSAASPNDTFTITDSPVAGFGYAMGVHIEGQSGVGSEGLGVDVNVKVRVGDAEGVGDDDGVGVDVDVFVHVSVGIGVGV